MATGDTVLVTGGAGFIGCALAERLAPTADRWVVLDNLHPQVHASGQRPDALHQSSELVVGDVTDPQTWDDLLCDFRPDIVVHLAAETGTAQSLSEATRHAQVNVVGTTEMLDAFGRHDHVPGHMVLSSSRAVYGEGAWQKSDGTLFFPGQRSHAQLAEGQWDFPDAASLPSSSIGTLLAPTSIYGATKVAQEHILTAWAGAHDAALTVLRLQNVYGPGQSLTNSYTGIVSLFSQLARAGKSIPLYEDGSIVRDFVLIDDVADAFVAVLQRGPAGRSEPYDIGTGLATTIAELARSIAAFHSAPEPHITGQFRDGDVRAASCNIAPTLAELSWKPRFALDEGIARLQEWIESQV
ncbi:NAD-dependent epimerase/dehydratase family protein [Glaciihabitans sp. UYNi722]|uniref:NAD-dependent epimerase/dehydratase family protein n=1 Tax=Glaciihabitans sp. UYNi722 TaxID=3156344 RepID=UPI0033942179